MKRPSEQTRRVLAWGVAAIVAIVAAQITTHLIDTGVYGLRIDALDSGLDSSVFGVASSLIVVIAAAAGIAAGLTSRQRWPGICGAALAAYALLSLLEVPQTSDGVLLVLPLLLLLLIGLWLSARDEPAPVGRLLQIAAGLLVLSFVLHIAVPFAFRHLGIATGSWPYEIKVAFKMASEIAGFGLVAVAFAAIVSEHTARGAPSVAAA
jgi:hypothetical protein